jgi:hypothetical protein
LILEQKQLLGAAPGFRNIEVKIDESEVCPGCGKPYEETFSDPGIDENEVHRSDSNATEIRRRSQCRRVELQQRKESPARQRPAGQVFVISTRIRTAPDRSGRVGGQKNRPVAIDLDVPDCMTATDLRKLTSGVVRKLAAGEIRGA